MADDMNRDFSEIVAKCLKLGWRLYSVPPAPETVDNPREI